MKPIEYMEMSEKDFYLLSMGFKQKKLQQTKELRQLMYVIVAGYADPKKLPPIHRWMPLEGDPEVRQITTESIRASIAKFKAWQQQGRTVN